jgi:outer membrane protein
MPRNASRRGLAWWRGIGGLMLLLLVGCQSQGDARDLEPSIATYRDRMLAEQTAQPEEPPPLTPANEPVARPVPWQAELPERRALVTRPEALEQPQPADVLIQIPDPEFAPQVFTDRLQALKTVPRPDERVIANYQEVVPRAIENLKKVSAGRTGQVYLGLAEAVQRALEHNFTIRFQAYNPAISRTQLIQAEAAFDAEFFLDTTSTRIDHQTFDPQRPNVAQSVVYDGGFRQLLPTGMRVETRLSQQRDWVRTDPADQQIRGLTRQYESLFTVSFAQPLLRGFGLDFNRAQINIARAQVNIAYEQFIQQVRQTLLDVETAYWRLAQARRRAVIVAETAAQYWTTYQALWRRREHDVTVVELSSAESRWRTREVQYLEAIRNIKDAEDQLKNLLNDPNLLLSQNLEIIPTEIPFMAQMAHDQFEAVRTALDQRSEIRAARQQIEQARINTSVAKNGTLPQLDLTFNYEVQGLGTTADNSFDHLTTNRYISYTVGVQFVMPIGNRGPRAAWRQAELQEAQTVVGLYQITDNIVTQVNTAARAIDVRYAQIPPQLEAVRSADNQLRAYQARTQRIDPLYLENELSSVERLANERDTLLTVITEYNIARIALEAAKGTLLEFNNVVVTDEPPCL